MNHSMTDTISQTNSVFQQPWWLDATAPGEWDSVEVEEQGEVVARLPFTVKKRHGMRVLGQPPLTQTLGPWIKKEPGAVQDQFLRERELFTKLIKKLPKFDIFQQNFHPDVTNWLPFYWLGFTQTSRYTFVLDSIKNTDALLSGMSNSTRKNVRRAERAITVSPRDDVKDVLDMAKLTFARQSLPLPYNDDLAYRIDDAASRFGKRIALSAADESGNTHAAIYVVGDERRMYCLISGIDPTPRKTDSGSLLQWKAIRAAAEHTDTYDFEGSMIEGIAQFYNKFGSAQTPYSAIGKRTGFVATRASALRQLLRG